jgi:hypothetical protein
MYACSDGLGNDGDGSCDTAAGTCTDGSTPGDAGCADATDSQELELTEGDITIFEIDRQTGIPLLIAAGDQLSGPRGLSIDADGQLLVADAGVDRVLRVDPVTGAQTVVAPTGGFNGPEYVSEDPADGTLLVSDYISSTHATGDPPDRSQYGRRDRKLDGQPLRRPAPARAE